MGPTSWHLAFSKEAGSAFSVHTLVLRAEGGSSHTKVGMRACLPPAGDVLPNFCPLSLPLLPHSVSACVRACVEGGWGMGIILGTEFEPAAC